MGAWQDCEPPLACAEKRVQALGEQGFLRTKQGRKDEGLWDPKFVQFEKPAFRKQLIHIPYLINAVKHRF